MIIYFVKLYQQKLKNYECELQMHLKNENKTSAAYI